MLAVCMNHEQEFEEMLSNDLCCFFNKKINEMKRLLETGDIDGMRLQYYNAINDTQERLRNKYLEIKKAFETKDPKLTSDYGKITQIINHKKLYDSMTFWMGA